MNRKSIERFRDGLLEWAEDNLRPFPWRRRQATLYEVFIAEFFLARTRTEVVAQVYPEFIDRYPTLTHLCEADKTEIAEVIRPLGLQNRRSEALVEICEVTDEELPTTPEKLRELPRVGDYVANATICFAEGEHLPIVDRNVNRIYRRLDSGWEELDDDERLERAAEFLPEREARTYNLALIDFASTVCTASNPSCESCFAQSYCEYYQEPC